ncbi:unnamed protein product [Orchesella dallaii]|uniref:Gustatory receptor n=1 Tax=Orchesella dallaii TaxID=48710 RepID=A0ABP1Q730_9HEXA
MPLQGFHLASVVGWASGVIILRKPWGPPTFRWLCVPSFLAVLYFIIVLVLNVDLMKNSHKIHAHSSQYSHNYNHNIDKLVTKFSYIQLILSCLVIRFIFFWKARKVADLLQRLRKYDKPFMFSRMLRKKKNQEVNRKPATNIDCAITHLVFLTTFSLGLADAYVAYHIEENDLWLQTFGNLVHGILLVVLIVVPLMAPVQCAFSLTVHGIAHLSDILKEYCEQILNILPYQRQIKIVNSKNQQSMSIKDRNRNCYYLENIFSQNSKQKLFFTNQFRIEILARFENIREIFNLADEIISPMALLLLACSSISVVMKSYELIVLYRSKVNFIRGMCHIVNYLSYFWILHSGQRIKDTVSDCKDKLKSALAELSNHTSGEVERQTIKDVLSVISLWDWKFTACDFFVIDKKLASGVSCT